MSLIGKSGSGETFKQAPEGLHNMICVDVIDRGMEEVVYKGEAKGPRHKCQVRWMIDTGKDERRSDGERFVIRRTYTLSTHPKSAFRDHVETWRGKVQGGVPMPLEFTEEEVKSFDFGQVVGWTGRVIVEHYQDREGNERAGIKGSPMPPGDDFVQFDTSGYTRQTFNPIEQKYEDVVDGTEEIPF